MKLAELFTEAQYQIAGPVSGDELPLLGSQGDQTEIVVDLRDKRIDMDNARGIVIKPKYTEAEQTRFIQKQMPPGTIFMVAQPGGGKAQYQVVRTQGNMIIATDPNSPDGAEVRIQGTKYYIDVDNSDGMIHFEDERSRAEKYRVISDLARKKATVTVESYELEEGKKDACYRKVKSRYKIWPSAYASGALVKCRKVGAKNWGNKSKKK